MTNPLNRLSAREKNITFFLIAIVAISLVYSFFLEPLYKRFKRVNSEITLTKIKLQKYASIIKDKSVIDKEFEEYANKLRSIGTDEQEMTKILNELETIASSSGVNIVSMRPKPAKGKEYYKRFVVEIETESDMNSLMKFIYKTKNSPQVLKTDKLNINTKSDKSGVIIRASLLISKISLT
ncbi:type 4a pilus biogenesis protein PilO [Candidatus Omnitrophota bacterium]